MNIREIIALTTGILILGVWAIAALAIRKGRKDVMRRLEQFERRLRELPEEGSSK